MLENHTYDVNGNRLSRRRGLRRPGSPDDARRRGLHVGRGRRSCKSRWGPTRSRTRARASCSRREGRDVHVRRARPPRAGRGRGKTKYLYGNPANPLQVTASVAGDVVTTYYYDADDRLFALERGGERYYVGADADGSPRIVVRASDGAVVRRVDLRRVRRRDAASPARSSCRSASPAACATAITGPRALRPARLRPGRGPLRGQATRASSAARRRTSTTTPATTRSRMRTRPGCRASAGRCTPRSAAASSSAATTSGTGRRLVGVRRGRRRRRRRRWTSTSSAARQDTGARGVRRGRPARLGMGRRHDRRRARPRLHERQGRAPR